MAFSEFKDEQDFMTQCGYTHDGLWYPRVTKIVDIKSKPALYMFYGEVGFHQGKAISAKSAEEGTAVHEAIEKIMIGQKPGNMPASIVPAVRAFLDFIKEVKIKVNPEHVAIAIERRTSPRTSGAAVEAEGPLVPAATRPVPARRSTRSVTAVSTSAAT